MFLLVYPNFIEVYLNHTKKKTREKKFKPNTKTQLSKDLHILNQKLYFLQKLLLIQFLIIL